MLHRFLSEIAASRSGKVLQGPLLLIPRMRRRGGGRSGATLIAETLRFRESELHSKTGSSLGTGPPQTRQNQFPKSLRVWHPKLAHFILSTQLPENLRAAQTC